MGLIAAVLGQPPQNEYARAQMYWAPDRIHSSVYCMICTSVPGWESAFWVCEIGGRAGCLIF